LFLQSLRAAAGDETGRQAVRQQPDFIRVRVLRRLASGLIERKAQRGRGCVVCAILDKSTVYPSDWFIMGARTRFIRRQSLAC